MKPVIEDSAPNNFRTAATAPVQETITAVSVPVDSLSENNAVMLKPDGVYASCEGAYCAYVFSSRPYTYLENDDLTVRPLGLIEGASLRPTIGEIIEDALVGNPVTANPGWEVEQVYFETSYTHPVEDALVGNPVTANPGWEVEQVYFETSYTHSVEDALAGSPVTANPGWEVEQVYFEIEHTQPAGSALLGNPVSANSGWEVVQV